MDTVRERQLLNSIAEGEVLLRNKKLAEGCRIMIKRSIESAKRKLAAIRAEEYEKSPKQHL